ncbi:hypothetical protein RY831_15125 [Noviherbaspirillum sp. CPCC 100848]|uniref:Uncharacterized protein n=1 Tax=Noviherbaspirillum album TaxID=3080276 RepID=A0ABU6JAD4_9BURK|nr:hypothetical protein [Noviherbaspirillum sp. CPCC 100848]MEC4720493.1 hypothetical protein [Noviherbaspirillum sp. CPCC 100848]
MRTCAQCEHAIRATTAGMTAFVWCQENVYGSEDGFVMQSHFINPKAKACGSKFLQRISPLPAESDVPFSLDEIAEVEAGSTDQTSHPGPAALITSPTEGLKSVVDRFGGIFI